MRKNDLRKVLLTAGTVAVVSLSLLSGCTPAFQWPGELRIDEARRRAELDVAAGHARIMKIGASNCWEPGIGWAEKDIVRWLPRETSRCGVVDDDKTPDLKALEKYAYAYNKQIVELLKPQP